MGTRLRQASFALSVLALTLSTCGFDRCLAATVQDQFLAEIKLVADQGHLSDPVMIGRLLQTAFTAERQSSDGGACAPGGRADDTRTSDFQTFRPAGDYWFRASPGGVQGMTVPAWLGRPVVLGQPRLTYSISHRQSCGDARHPALHEETDTLVFDAVPAFMCVTEDQLKAALPQAKLMIATDGAWPYRYAGPQDDHEGTEVRLNYVFKPQCLISVEITQSTTNSARYARARDNLETCAAKAAARPGKTGVPSMVGGERAACKSYWDYLAEEPERD